jgi:hypothetical protein
MVNRTFGMSLGFPCGPAEAQTQVGKVGHDEDEGGMDPYVDAETRKTLIESFMTMKFPVRALGQTPPRASCT